MYVRKCIFSDPIIYDDYNGGAAKKLAIIELVVGGVAIGMNVAAIVMELENSYDGSFIGSGIFVRIPAVNIESPNEMVDCNCENVAQSPPPPEPIVVHFML